MKINQRPVEFRVWDKEEKSFMDYRGKQGQFFNFGCAAYLTNILDGLCPTLIVTQFTGLLDKNKKKIFEGDIVRISLFNSLKKLMLLPCPVIFKKAGFRVESRYIDGSKAEFYYELLGDCDMKKFEVISNIFENPELLEENAKT